MRTLQHVMLAVGLLLAGAVASAQTDRSLWIAKFTGEPKAGAALASIQQSDFEALQYGNLFKNVASFATQPNQPAGTWTLSAAEVSYDPGSAAVRALIGHGTGRAHLEMNYELRDSSGKVVWTKTIKTEPSLWSYSAHQSQSAALRDQSQKLLDELSKFFAPKKKKS